MDRSRGLASDVMVATTKEPTVMKGMQRLSQPAGQPAYMATPAEAAVEAAPARQTYKSCTFCAKRKRACDSRRPRCSLCIEKNQPHCHYPLKPLPKRSAPSRRLSSSSSSSSDCSISSGDASKAKRLAEAHEVASYGTGGVLATVDTRSMPAVPVRMSLKRCRLSASPATGLVGMQENGFLGDFFGCLGILPLTAESTVRNAMVEVMMRQCGGQAYSGTGGSGTEGLAEDGEKGWSGGLALARRHTLPDHPAICMMWCAIALGALMRGIPVEHVMGYVQLARKSLADCFDGRSVEHARAYLIMSFLHSIIHDEDKNERYLSFAVNIVSMLRPEDVPKELNLMLMTTDKLRVSPCNQQPGDDLSNSCVEAVEVPRVRESQHLLTPTDVSNAFLAADSLITQAFVADMTSAGAIPASGGGATPHEENEEPILGEETYRELGGGGVMKEGGKRVWNAGVAWEDEELAHRVHREPDVPPAGPAMKLLIREALPEMTSLAKTLESSDTCSGVGGVLYHGNVAYMRAVAGELVKAFESLEACVDVVLRYPGLVRFKSHLIHCMLAASHFFNRRDMYDAMRGVYNSVGPMGYPQAPPYEEWRTIRQVCPHVLCRSLEVQLHQHLDEGLVQTNAAPKDPETAESFSGSFNSTRSGSDSQSSGAPPAGLASGEGSPPPPTAAGVTAVSSPLPAPPHTFPTFMPDGGGNDDASAGDMRLQPGLVTTAMLIPEAVYSAKGEAGDVRHADWLHAAATSEQPRSGTGARAPGSPKTGLEWWGGDVVSGGAELNMSDADLLDIAAAFANDGGLLEEELL